MRNDEQNMSASSKTWPRPHRLTVDEYYRMAEVGLLGPDDRTELIEGEIIDMPPIGDRHADVVRILTKRLVQAAGDSADVSCQLPVRLSRRSEPQPDFVLLERKPESYRKHPIPADVLLLIEVSDSTLGYDLGKRAQLYAAHMIPEYWVIDLQHERVWRHRMPALGKYGERDEIVRGSLTLPSLGSEIDVGELFAH